MIQEFGRGATGTPAPQTLSLLAPRPRGWKTARRCWSTRARANTLPSTTAPSHFTKTCRSNLQQEQACSGLRSTMVIATSAAGLWSSAPYSAAESQPLGRSPKERNALKAAARGARQPVRVSPGRVAGRPQRRRPPLRPSLPGASASEGTPRSGQRDAASRSGPGGRRGRAESGRPRRRGPPRETAGPQANLSKGDSAGGWAV